MFVAYLRRYLALESPSAFVVTSPLGCWDDDDADVSSSPAPNTAPSDSMASARRHIEEAIAAEEGTPEPSTWSDTQTATTSAAAAQQRRQQRRRRRQPHAASAPVGQDSAPASGVSSPQREGSAGGGGNGATLSIGAFGSAPTAKSRVPTTASPGGVKLLSSWWTGALFHKQPATESNDADSPMADRTDGDAAAAAAAAVVIAEAEPPSSDDARRRSMTAGQWELADADDCTDSDDDWEILEDE
jgi:hypothetical protein